MLFHASRVTESRGDLFLGKDAYLIAVTEHGGENVLQQGQDVLVGLEQTPHGLQLHHLRVRALRDWEVKQARVSYRVAEVGR